MAKVLERLGVGLVIALASMPVGCGGSSDGAGGNAGDAGTPAKGDGGIPALDAGTDATQASGSDAGSSASDAATSASDAAQDSTTPSDSGSNVDSGVVATEPAYLRNDAIAGFAYTANFGSPYDSILAAPLDTTQSAIDSSYTTSPTAAQFEASNMFSLVANSADLYSALNISASFSVSVGLASASAKTDFARSTTIDSTDLWAVVDLSEQGPTTKIVNPTITAQAAALSPDQFFALYGDRYAAEIVTGAEMFCTLQIHTTSQEDKSSLSVSLSVGYGASSASGAFTSDSISKIGSHQTTVRCGYVGFKPGDGGVPTTLPALLSAASDFQSGNANDLGDVSTSALYLLYTSYYGLAGYPGLPAAVPPRVTQQAQLASDYLLYNSLVQNDFAAYYADSTYSTKPFFADMKAYRDGLSQFITASIDNSLNPGVPAPVAAADGLITNWATTTALTAPAGNYPQYTVYKIANGIVPKTISDYAIPLRYAYPDASGHGTLNGTTFSPVSPVGIVGQKQQALNYPLYLTANKAGVGTGPWLEYQWDSGTYFLPSATDSTGAPNATQIDSAFAFSLAGNVSSQYVVISKANGFVLSDNGSSTPMTATHLSVDTATTSVTPSQLWEFYVDSGNIIQNCSTYVPPPAGGKVDYGCSYSSNGVVDAAGNPPCGSEVYAISALHTGYWENTGTTWVTTGGGGCDYCNWNCSSFHCPYSGCSGGPVPNDTIFLQPYDNGTTQAIYDFQGNQSGATWYMEADLSQTSTNPNSNNVLAETPPIGGYGNELWVFVPAADVDTAPNP